MNKINILFLLFIFILPISNINIVNADTILNGTDLYYVGKSINVAKASSTSDFCHSVSVLSNNYYFNELSVANKIGGSNGATYFSMETKKEKIINDIKINYSNEIETSYGDLDVFSCSLKNNFSWSTNSELTKVYSKLYMSYTQNYMYGSQFINDYKMNYVINELKNNLHFEYLSDLELLSSKELSYNSFFDKYGTHLIAEATLGDRLNIEVIVGSNEVDFSVNCASNLGVKSSADFLGLLGAKSNTNLSLEYKYGCSSERTIVEVNSTNLGGNSFGITDYENMGTYISSWNESAKENPYILGFGNNNDGLIPLYDLLPDNSNIDKSEMEYQMVNYILNNEYDSDIKEDTVNLSNNLNKMYNFRDSNNLVTYTITDSGRFTNGMDCIDLYNMFGYGYQILKNEYSYFSVIVTADCYSKKNGNKYVFIYNQNTKSKLSKFTSTDGILLLSDSISGKIKSYKNKKFDFGNERVSTDYLTEYLWILYGASGWGSDTWYNNNVEVTITFYKENI